MSQEQIERQAKIVFETIRDSKLEDLKSLLKLLKEKQVEK